MRPSLAVTVFPGLASMVLLIHISCQPEEKSPTTLFSLLSSQSTGIEFRNELDFNDSVNILNYIYFFNGGGVGIGDFNRDGLEDVFLTGNQVSSRLYLNQGDLKFEDWTDRAGVGTRQWCTGVSVVDLNLDGWDDIYISVAGAPDPGSRKNLFFINNQDNSFIEQADQFGIADPGYSTHSAFFDYDQDGDLDLYVLNHANQRDALNTPLEKKINGQGASNDRLYRNNGDNTFKDVSGEAGILIEGYGLGLAISDINQDGWPDIYISNDFITNDVLYVNNGDGTFSNKIDQLIREQSYNGMGCDIMDFNNDGWSDIVVLDMLPPGPIREKTMAGSMTSDKFELIRKMGYEPQFVRNTLELE